MQPQPADCRVDHNGHLSTRQYARLVDEWVTGVGLMRSEYGTHSLRRTKASIIYGRPETFVPSRSCSVIASRKHNALSWDRRGRRACPRGEYRNLTRWLLASGEGPLHGAWDFPVVPSRPIQRQVFSNSRLANSCGHCLACRLCPFLQFRHVLRELI